MCGGNVQPPTKRINCGNDSSDIHEPSAETHSPLPQPLQAATPVPEASLVQAATPVPEASPVPLPTLSINESEDVETRIINIFKENVEASDDAEFMADVSKEILLKVKNGEVKEKDKMSFALTLCCTKMPLIRGAGAVAVACTDLEELKNIIFIGMSPQYRTKKEFKAVINVFPEREITTPDQHAESDIGNKFLYAFDSCCGRVNRGKREGNLIILISRKACKECIAGINNPSVSAGVLKQLSTYLPKIVIAVNYLDNGKVEQQLVLENGRKK